MGLIFDTKIAKAYDSWYQSKRGRAFDRSLETLLASLLTPIPGERVLDIGCGSGNHLLILNRLGLDVSGVDASNLMVYRAKNRLGRRCSIKLGNAEDLPFEDNEVDYAVLIHTLEFLDDPLPALREAGRVAKKKVLVGIMNPLSYDGIVRRIQGFLGDPLFHGARFFHLWDMKSFLRMAYGPVPLSWRCLPSFLSDPFHSTSNRSDSFMCTHWPFSSFLCISATLVYTVRTENLPLKIRLKEARHGAIGTEALNDIRQVKGVNGNE